MTNTKAFQNLTSSRFFALQALGEAAIKSDAGDLPVVVIRPSIVVASWKEPVRGWIENLNGLTGTFAAAGKGILRSVYCK